MKRSMLFVATLVFVLVAVSLGSGSASAASSPAPALAGGNAISVRAQDAYVGRVVVDSVTADQPAWLLIRKNASGAPGTVLGAAAVSAGTTQGLVVNIRTTNNRGQDALSSTLWATLAPAGYTINPGVGGYDDLGQRGVLAATAFASTLAGGASPNSNSPALAQSGSLPATGGQYNSSGTTGSPNTGSLGSGSNTTGSNVSGTGSTGSGATGTTSGAISARGQDATNGQVLIDSVNAAQDGWLLIRRDQGSMPGQVLGYAPVYRGLNSNVRVSIRTTNDKGDNVLGSRLWATVVADPNALLPFTSPSSDVQDQGSQSAVAFNSTSSSGAAPALAGNLPSTGGANNPAPSTSANQINVRGQDTNNGQIYIDSVNAAQDGWLLIRRSGPTGQVLGFAPVHAGLNNGVRVSIRTSDSKGNNAVTQTLWATLTSDPNANLAFASPSSDVQNQGSTAAVAFSSTLAGANGSR